MTEKNRDIFKQALNNLPKYKADRQNWTALSASLDHQDASRFIQNNKVKLPGHKAPPGTWNGIAKGLTGSLWTGTTGLLLKIGSVALISATVVTAFLLLDPEKEIDEPLDSPASQTDQLESRSLPEEPVKPAANSLTGKTQSQKRPEEVIENISERKDASIVSEAGDSEKNVYVLESSNVNDDPMAEFENALADEPQNLPGLLLSEKFRLNAEIPRITTVPIRTKYPVKNLRDDYYQEKRGFEISLGASYGWMHFNNVDPGKMEIPSSVSAVGMDLLFEKDRFYLKTGLAYTSWEELAGYEFRYNKNELVYNYQYVDSAFVVPGTNQITYFTTEQEVYDSVFYQKDDVVRNRYKVLQIPLIFGYKLVESRKWMVGLTAGFGADFNLSSNVLTPIFDEDQSTLVGVDNQLVYRPTINWRLMAGAGVYYRMNNRISIFLEPGYHTYLNTVYPGTGLKNVSYFEVKFGILYRF